MRNAIFNDVKHQIKKEHRTSILANLSENGIGSLPSGGFRGGKGGANAPPFGGE